MSVRVPRPTTRPGSTADRLRRFIYGNDQASLAVGYDDNARAIDAILLGTDDETAGLNWRVVWVAAAGFFTDSYNLFSSNVILPALTYIYWDDGYKGRQNGFNVATLLGSMIGQVIFGVAVDIYGRRALYGLELVIVIVSTLGLLQCSSGYWDAATGATWSITPWLFCWRVAMGIGIGAEYPLSATIAAEWSSKHSRARMMSLIFAMQPLGQLVAYCVGLIAITHLDSTKKDIDKFWRIVIGVGAIPTLLALGARPFLPESWRFTYFVVKNETKAQADLSRVYGSTNAVPRRRTDEEMVEINNTAATATNEHHDGPQPVQNGNSANGAAAKGGMTATEEQPVQEVNRMPSDMSHAVAWTPGDQFRNGQFWEFIRQKDNRNRLLGTSVCWALLDFAFYGMGFNSPATLAKLWSKQDLYFAPDAPDWQTSSIISNITDPYHAPVVNGTNPDGSIPYWTINAVMKSNMQNAIFTTQIAAIIGSIVFILTANLLNRRKMLIGTFFAVAVVLAAIAGSIKQLFHNGADGNGYVEGGSNILIGLWALAMFLFNFGPNTLTFILPAELFPTRYRCTCYGIAACCGKAGAVVIQCIIWGLSSRSNNYNNYTDLQGLMSGFSVVMLIGGLCALIPGWIPDVQNGLETKSLEELTDDQQFIQRPTRDDDSR